ncbi:hypothetical protein BKA93DRAFT_812269 [Sparassis latifolia]
MTIPVAFIFSLCFNSFFCICFLNCTSAFVLPHLHCFFYFVHRYLLYHRDQFPDTLEHQQQFGPYRWRTDTQMWQQCGWVMMGRWDEP